MGGLVSDLARKTVEECLALTLVVLLGWLSFVAGVSPLTLDTWVESVSTVEIHRF